MGWHAGVCNGVMIVLGCSLGFGCRPRRACFVTPFYPERRVLTHIPKPQAHWLLLVQWCLEAGLGRSLWIIPYVFPFGVCAGERCRGGFVLLLGVVFFFGEEYLISFVF